MHFPNWLDVQLGPWRHEGQPAAAQPHLPSDVAQRRQAATLKHAQVQCEVHQLQGACRLWKDGLQTLGLQHMREVHIGLQGTAVAQQGEILVVQLLHR